MMRNIISNLLLRFIILFLLLSLNSLAQTTIPNATAEAENGVLSGGVTTAKAISGYSGTGYVTNFTNSSNDKVTVKMNVAVKGFYKLIIRYQSDYKEQYLYVNGSGPSKVSFPKTSVFADVDAGKYLLNAGENTFTIQSSWGWINIDKFSLYAVSKNTYSITPSLINPNATPETKSLYAFLVSKFNHVTISGQTDDYFSQINTISGKTPMIRGFDFQHYTKGYAYLWNNNINGHSFGWDDNGTTQKAIDWYTQTGGKGIVTFQWHWHSPFGGKAGTNTFYTESTTFDITKAVQPGTLENSDILRDIDSIATQLKKFQSAGVPVLWRPLHEAGGGWFWWGAKGPVACKRLYQIMYDRLTNHHNLNNLIWVWSTPETDWYPGNDSVDIVGYDSYPGEYNYDPQKSTFDVLYKLVNGEKLITMSENGPIPDPESCLAYDAPWLYFMSWSNLVTSQNTNRHISEVFINSKVITLENPTALSLISSDIQCRNIIYPNPAIDKFYITEASFDLLQILDISGKVVLSLSNKDGNTKTIHIPDLINGTYLVRILSGQKHYQQKLVIFK